MRTSYYSYYTHAISADNAILIHNPTNSVMNLAAAIVSNFVCLLDSEDSGTDYMVHKYGKEVLSLFPYFDAIREGVRERIMTYWKFLLVIFKASNQYNYAKEAVNIILQYHYYFPETQKAELLWSRHVNTR